MWTNKKRTCKGDCCTPEGKAAGIECACFDGKAECDEDCGCDPTKCKNRQMSLRQSLKLGDDVEERISWGIDICTALNLICVLPMSLGNTCKSDFIEDKLIFAIQ